LINPRNAFARAKVEHFASVDLSEVPAMMQRVALEDSMQSVLAFRLFALTWVRTGELRARMGTTATLSSGNPPMLLMTRSARRTTARS